MKYIYDIESFPNFFSLVLTQEDWQPEVFIIHESQDDRVNLLEKLRGDHAWFGYNNTGYDGHVVEALINNPYISVEELNQVSQTVIHGDFFKYKKLSTKQIDLFTMWSFDNMQRYTSLKWLEFTMRALKLKDSPLPWDKPVSPSKIQEVIRYNKNDVLSTLELYRQSFSKIQLRQELFKKDKNFKIFSLGDVRLGERIFKNRLSTISNVPKEGIKRDDIHIKDLILPSVKFHTPKFNEVLDHFNSIRLIGEDGAFNLSGKALDFVLEDRVGYFYGGGGLHASISGDITPPEGYVLRDFDVASFYPSIAIQNKLKPAHLDDAFSVIYREMFEERMSIPKTDHRNGAYKLALNAVFGKSKSIWSFLYDPVFTLSITINGQLLLSMLIEQFLRVGEVIQANTDGVTILYPKDTQEKIDKIVDWWQRKTGLQLEEKEYSRMIMRDVNNYIAIDNGGNVKRKGAYCIYEDFVNREEYNKNPSATIIPLAVSNYYTQGVPLEETIRNHEDIFEYLYGYKKKSTFDFVFLNVKDGHVIPTIIRDKVIRYFADAEGASLYKLTDKSFTSLGVGTRFTLLQSLRSAKGRNTSLYSIDYEHYIKEAEKLLI